MTEKMTGTINQSSRMALLERLNPERVRPSGTVVSFIGRHAQPVQPAGPLRGYLQVSESPFAEHLLQISKIKCPAMLPVAKHKICKPALARMKVAKERVREPVSPILLVREDGAACANKERSTSLRPWVLAPASSLEEIF
jgi:hypothetical protein